MLAGTTVKGGIRHKSHNVTCERRSVLDDLHIGKMQSHRWQSRKPIDQRRKRKKRQAGGDKKAAAAKSVRGNSPKRLQDESARTTAVAAAVGMSKHGDREHPGHAGDLSGHFLAGAENSFPLIAPA